MQPELSHTPVLQAFWACACLPFKRCTKCCHHFLRLFKVTLQLHFYPAITALGRWQLPLLFPQTDFNFPEIWFFKKKKKKNLPIAAISHYAPSSSPFSPPQVLQSALYGIRHGRTGSRLVNIYRQHQYVSMWPASSRFWTVIMVMTMDSISGLSVCTLLCVWTGW